MRMETEVSNSTEVTMNRCSDSVRVEGRREYIIKDGYTFPSLKEGRKMVRNRKVRKRNSFGDEKVCEYEHSLHITILPSTSLNVCKYQNLLVSQGEDRPECVEDGKKKTLNLTFFFEVQT